MTLKILLWFARILAIAAILFISLFALDVFEGTQSFGIKLLAFLKHNIPDFLFLIALIVSWKNKLAGGIFFIVLFFAAGIFWKSFTGNWGSLILILPFAISGLIFIIYGLLTGRSKTIQ